MEQELQETNPYPQNPYRNSTTKPNHIEDDNENDSDADIEAIRPLRSSRKSRPPSVVINKRETFAKSIRTISIEKPPIKDPVGYTSSVLGLCCVLPVAGCGIFCAGLLIAWLNLIPITMIVMGALYFNKEEYCPVENIAMLLVVGGSVMLVQGVAESVVRIIGFCRKVKGDESNTTHNHPAIQIMNMILRLVTFAWLIAACVIVYRVEPDVSFDSSTSSTYCHPVLFTFAFWLVTLILVLIGLAGVLLICSCMCVLFIKN